jgi:hypothetical protein
MDEYDWPASGGSPAKASDSMVACCFARRFSMSGPLRWRHVVFAAFSLTIALVLAAVGAAGAQQIDPGELQALREFLGPASRVHQRRAHELLADRDVVGTAVGLTAMGEPAIKVFTKSEAIMRLPQQLEGVAVEIEMTGTFHALGAAGSEASPTNRAPALLSPAKVFPRPVPIGVSTGNQVDCSAGTIGARVRDSQGNVYALSNNHVYALENTAEPNSSIVQPGRADAGCRVKSQNVIGTLSSFVPIEFSESANNTVDAAIALSDVSLLGNATPRSGYGTPQSSTVSAFVGQRVQKFGERSKLTRGQVSGIDATVLVEYDSGTARFVNQIIVTSPVAFIRAGDSGSLLVTRPDKHPVGLLFAGNETGRKAIANPIDAVLGSFGVSIDGQ